MWNKIIARRNYQLTCKWQLIIHTRMWKSIHSWNEKNISSEKLN